MSANASVIADEDGDYSDWIEIYNGSDETISLVGLGLSDDPDLRFKWIFPDVRIQPQGFLLIFASGKNRREVPGELHTNFRILAIGEDLFLTEPDGDVIDLQESVRIEPDVSFGRLPDGGDRKVYFELPSPGESNGEIQRHRSPRPVFSRVAGFYEAGTRLEIFSPDSSAIIRFTTDGNVPTDSSEIYSQPIELDSVTVFTAVSFAENMLPSRPVSASYLVDFVTDLPVVSIITPPDNFWDWDRGIYVMGPDASENYPFFGANFWEDWEIPVQIEYFDSDGTLLFHQGAGVKITGSWSRGFPQKSLKITAREQYGADRIDYPVFQNRPFQSYQSLVLRNAGNDWDKTLLRDPLNSSLMEDRQGVVQAYQPVVVFLDGRYWGIHNLREKVNEYYLANHYGAVPGDIDLLENYFAAHAGDSRAFMILFNYVRDNDLSQAAVYDSVKKMMDVKNFLHYIATEIFIANRDWPGNNIKYWRNREDGARFRWLMYDTDQGFYSPHHATLDTATAEYLGNWTVMQRKLLENPTFRNKFIIRICDLWNSTLSQQHTLARIEEMVSQIESEIDNHVARWYPEQNWETHVNLLRSFARQRKAFVVEDMQEYFDLGDLVEISFEQDNSDQGRIWLNSFFINEADWRGDYFTGLRITARACPAEGYRFVEWTGDINSDRAQIWFSLEEPLTLTPVFEQVDDIVTGVVINEINYNSSPDFNPGDWIELFAYRGNHYLSGWIMKDSEDDHLFRFPAGLFLAEGDHIVIAENLRNFSTQFPDVENVIGDLGFGLGSTDDYIRLYDNGDALIDSVAYDSNPPWSFRPDGLGPTLQLINAAYPNHSVINWGVSLMPYGDPGTENHTYDVREKAKLLLPAGFRLNSAFPNPFNSWLNLEYTLTSPGNIEIILYDLTGKIAQEVVSGFIQPGVYRSAVDGTTLASGSYFLKITSSGNSKAILINHLK